MKYSEVVTDKLLQAGRGAIAVLSRVTAGAGLLMPVPEPIGLKSNIRRSGVLVKIAFDYVTRTFQRIFGTAE
jgi:hypothetical protein